MIAEALIATAAALALLVLPTILFFWRRKDPRFRSGRPHYVLRAWYIGTLIWIIAIPLAFHPRCEFYSLARVIGLIAVNFGGPLAMAIMLWYWEGKTRTPTIGCHRRDSQFATLAIIAFFGNGFRTSRYQTATLRCLFALCAINLFFSTVWVSAFFR